VTDFGFEHSNAAAKDALAGYAKAFPDLGLVAAVKEAMKQKTESNDGA
jgi:hypothetical protein